MSETPRGRIFVFALTATCVTSALAGLMAAAVQRWFGVYDVAPLAFWSLPLGCVTGAVAVRLSPLTGQWRLLTRHVLSVAIGGALGSLWTFAVAALWGPWWGAMSLPALACWVAGGVAGVAGGLVLAAATPGVRIASVGFLAALSAVLVLANGPFVSWLSRDQTLAVVFLTWEPRDEPLSIESEHAEPPGDDVLSLLRLANVRGHVTLKWGGSVHGRGPEAKVLILLRGPVANRVTLQQPERTTVLYAQEPNGFEVWGGAAGVWYSVEEAGGGRASGPAFSW